ncbi:MAG: hypothetical protein K2Y20_07285 [Sphingomonas sp.]|nr:hypothetical protein [Sphingomonas sp.]
MTSLNPIALAAAAALMAVLPAAPVAAQSMIVRSSGPAAPQYPVGRKLAADSTITLGNGDLLVLLDAQGTRTIRGPGTFPASSAASTRASANSSVATLLTAQRRSRARTGAVRNPGVGGTPARSPNLWYVDVSRSQTVCTPDLADIILWRPDIAAPAIFHIVANGSKSEAAVDMAEGQSTAAWPVALPPLDGASFTIARSGADPLAIKLVKIDRPPADAEAVAAMLITHGCTAQLDVMLAAVSAN